MLLNQKSAPRAGATGDLEVAGQTDQLQIRDRIKELRRVRACELVPNPRIGAAIRERRLRRCAAYQPRSATPMRCSPANYSMGVSC